MNRAVQRKTNILIAAVIAIVSLFGGGAFVLHAHASDVQVVTNAQQHFVQITYQGRTGVTALALLTQHMNVGVKHYSFGDMVVSINGVVGGGPKYWTFYVNGRMADVGAGAYMTHSGDILMWKLQ